MKPYKTLLILLVFMVFLYGPSIFHLESIHPGNSVSINLPQVNDLLLPLSFPEEDAEMVSDELVESPPARNTIDISALNAIEAPGSSDVFLSLIDSLAPGERQLRIMYYGDSQMEGDRITDYLRKILRDDHGGSGPGLLQPAMLVPYTRTAYIRSSSNWLRYDYRALKQNGINRSDLGPLLSFSRFRTEENVTTDAWIRIRPSKTADKYAKEYNLLRIFYGRLKDSLSINIKDEGKIIYSGWLLPTVEISEFRCDLASPAGIEIAFSGISSPDLYGLSIESDSGLVIDNIPLRGSAGLEFTRAGKENLRESYRFIDPDLIILHFGLNVVLNIKDDYSYYEENIFRQIEHLKIIYPGCRILLIGVTDMAREDESGIHSYPNIPLIVEAQRRAALRSGVLFWDSWTQMGGKDAIVEWRKNDPPLASNDYTHISYEGGHKMAAMLYAAMTNGLAEPDTVGHDSIMTPGVDSVVSAKNYGPLRIISEYDTNRPLMFTMVGFWIFLLALLCIYSLIFNKPMVRNTYLFLFSLLFYYKSGGIFFSLLLISTITDYAAGWMIYLSNKKYKKTAWLVFSLFVNLGMLAYFKYTAFFAGAVNTIFGTDIPQQDWLAVLTNSYFGTEFNINSIVLPVGISFFTFQTISYTIDVYRNKIKPVKNILDFGFYVSFFPQLVAGPIVRASEFVPQLYKEFSLSKREWSHALLLIVAGLVKKIVVSDYIAVNFVDNIFASPGSFSGLENLLAVYGYGLQIYCDFSGYTDIAIGIALMLGFRLPVNFNSPYKASNITDFWRRWHISLSRWLKDYLYIPLGGNRNSKIRTSFNLLITMLLGGLWHGAAFRFIIWGGLHGAGLVIHKLWMRITNTGGKGSRLARLISIFITFNFVSFCWIFFRAEDMETARIILERIITGFDPGNILLMLLSYAKVLTVMIAAYIIHFLPVRVKESYRGLFIRMPLLVQIMLVYIVAIAIYNIQLTDIQPFIYFRF